NPTCPPVVAAQYSPGKFRCPRYDGNPRTGSPASNSTDAASASGLRYSPPASRQPTSNPSVPSPMQVTVQNQRDTARPHGTKPPTRRTSQTSARQEHGESPGPAPDQAGLRQTYR